MVKLDVRGDKGAGMTETLGAERWLASAAGQQRLRDMAAALPLSAKDVQRLRQEVGPELFSRLVEVAEQRGRSLEKLTDVAGAAEPDALLTPLVTGRALQQATDAVTANYKASCFPAGVPVFDVCCGAGGDAMALSRRGPMVAVDADPQLARYAAFNIKNWGGDRAAVLCQRAESLRLPPEAWLHIDPDRRAENRRTSSLEYSIPPLPVVNNLIEQAAGAAIKLAPAAELPAEWQGRVRREWIGRQGSCRQQLVWFLPPRGEPSNDRWATWLGGSEQTPQQFSCSEAEVTESVCERGAADGARWLFDLDATVRAAGLSEAFAARVGLLAVGNASGFFRGESEQLDVIQRSGWDRLAIGFRVVWQGRWREKVVREALKMHPSDDLEIKVRGVDVRPEAIRKRLLKGGKGGARAGNRLRQTLLIGADERGRAYAVLAQRERAAASVR